MTEIQRSASYDTIADGATHDICDGADGKQSDSVAGDAAAAHSTNGVKASAKATATITPCRAAVAGDDDAVDDKPVQWRRIMHYQQLGVLLLCLISALLTFANDVVDASDQRTFSLLDASLANEHKDDSVPFYIVIIVFPLAMVVVWVLGAFGHLPPRPFSSGPVVRAREHLRWCSTLFSLSLLTNFVLVYVLWAAPKKFVGRPRPDFLSRCVPDPAVVATATATQLFDATVCTSSDTDLVNDGFTSFPSGHAAFSFAACVWLSLYMAWLSHLRTAPLAATTPPTTPPKTPPSAAAASAMTESTVDTAAAVQPACVTLRRELTDLLSLISIIAPVFLAWFIAFSRIRDNRHFPADILAGALVGTACAVFTFAHSIAFYTRWCHLFN